MLAVKGKHGKRINPRRIVLEQLRLRLGFERRLRLQLMTLFSDLAEEAIRNIEGGSDLRINVVSVQRDLTEILHPFLASVIEEFGKLTINQKAMPLFDRLVHQYMREHAAVHIRNISVTTMRQMRSVLARAERETLGTANTAKLIRGKFQGQFARTRAAVIARTETHGAMTYAQIETAREQLDQQDLMKQWVSVGDDRTRSHHRAVNGQKVAIDDKFEVRYKGFPYLMDRPADPRGGPANVINCRCAMIFVYPEDDVAPEKPQASPDSPWLYRENIKPTGDLQSWFKPLFIRYRRMDEYDEEQVNIARDELGLDDDEIRAVMQYTGTGYMEINSNLRDWFYKKREVPLEIKEALIGINQTIAGAFRKMPAYKGNTARGISVDNVENFIRDNEIKVGSTYRAESVFSSKTGDRPDSYFAGNVTYRIQSVHGRYIDDISINKGEAEVLFPAGHEFEITDVEVRRRGVNQDGEISGVTIFMRDIMDDVKTDRTFISELITKSVRQSMRKRMQSEAPLASVNGVLLKGV